MLLLFGVLPFAYSAGGAYTEDFPRLFNSRTWISRQGLDDTRRCAMLTDLKLRVGITGKTREEVIALLGQPEDRSEEPRISRWMLCPSFLDVWVLAVRWQDGRAVETIVHDT